jgi:hypothetical protein
MQDASSQFSSLPMVSAALAAVAAVAVVETDTNSCRNAIRLVNDIFDDKNNNDSTSDCTTALVVVPPSSSLDLNLEGGNVKPRPMTLIRVSGEVSAVTALTTATTTISIFDALTVPAKRVFVRIFS